MFDVFFNDGAQGHGVLAIDASQVFTSPNDVLQFRSPMAQLDRPPQLMISPDLDPPIPPKANSDQPLQLMINPDGDPPIPPKANYDQPLQPMIDPDGDPPIPPKAK